MSSLTKKIIASIVTLSCAVLMMAPGSANALTADELQAQIDKLYKDIAALQAQLAGVPGGSTTGVPAACTGITFTRNLKQTMTGNDVKCLQAMFNQSPDTKVAASGAGSPGSETTYFGALTKAAAVKFQEKYASEILTPLGLTAGTGFVATATRTKLNSILASGGTTPTPPPDGGLPTATGLTVELAADTPVGTSIIADATNGGQALIPYAKLKFSTPAGSSAKVTTLKFKRLGISTDADIPYAYLYDGDTKIAEMNSLSAGVVTFTSSAGLFTVSGTKTITVKADLLRSTTAGKTIGFGVIAATDVVTDASAVNGSFPVNGNLMTTAVITDFGSLDVSTSTNSATIDPGTNGFEAFRFTLLANNQKIKVYSLKFQQMGSIQRSDIANLALYSGSTQLGSTVASLDSNNAVIFDFSSNPLEIAAGLTRTLSLKVDVIGGSTRTIEFAIQKSSDVVAKDDNYGVYVTPYSTVVGTYTVQDSTAVTVNSGNITVSKSSDSPSGNVALNSVNVTLAKYDVKAVGEDIRVSSMIIKTASTSATDWGVLKNVKIFYDGAQIGTTQQGTGNNVTYTVNFTAPVGQTKVLTIVSDIDEYSGSGSLDSGEKITASLVQGVNNAQRMTSLGTFNFPSAATVDGNELTVTTATFSVSKNTSVGDIAMVTNSKGVIIGSYLLTAGSAEGLDVSKIAFMDADNANSTTAGANALGDAFNNLELYYGTTKLGTTITTNGAAEAAGQEYAFYPSGFSLAAGQTARIDLKADVLGATTWTNGDATQLSSAEATGKLTSQGATINEHGAMGSRAGQAITLSGAGVLTLAIDSSTPEISITPMGKTDVTLGVWKLSANSTEDLTLTRVIVQNNGVATSSGMVQNLKLYCGSTQFGVAADALITPAAGNTYAPFAVSDNSCVIPKGSYKLITLKGDVTPYASSKFGTGGAGYYVASTDFMTFYLQIPATITGISTDTLVAKSGSGAYASSTALASSSANNAFPYRASLAASMACNGSCTTRTRSATDKVANITLSSTGDTNAMLRAANSASDDTILANWGKEVLANALHIGNVKLQATSTTYQDGNSAIWWYASGSAVGATTTYVVYNFGTSTVDNYARFTAMVYVSGWATTTEVFISSYSAATSSDTGYSTAAAADKTTVTLKDRTWNLVDIPLTTATSGTAYVGFAVTTGGAGADNNLKSTFSYVIDAVKLYTDSMSITVGGNVSTTATGTPFYVKTTGGTTKATGYYSPTAGTVKLIPDVDIEVGSTGATYELITATTILLAADTTAAESLTLSSSLGTSGSAGDFGWYDQAVEPKTPITWLNGASPISVSLTY